jgi:hypothetical protein
MISKELSATLRNVAGVSVSSLMIPKKGIDMTKWSVVACDQYTSEPQYWKDTADIVGDSPSTLRLIYPEAFLDLDSPSEKSERISTIHRHMDEYLKGGIFDELKDSMILTERSFPCGKKRLGLVLSLDLEKYDYSKGSQSLIRATEGTIIERLPPRILIRENAPLELPHIMVLIDDPGRTVIEPLHAAADSLEKAYDFDLMQGGGSIKGWVVDQAPLIEQVCSSLARLGDPAAFRDRYGLGDGYEVLLFAVGDGNHSLATAKACWDKLKSTLTPEEAESHPARFALVEVVNLHDDGLVFEPINRLLFNVDAGKFLESFVGYCSSMGSKAYISTEGYAAPGIQVIGYVTHDSSGFIVVENPKSNLDVATLQGFIDMYLKENPKAAVDYVHGFDVVNKIGRMSGNMGFFLSPMDKNALFKTVILDGALPRKSFSMGEASEKRFYLEARRIR